MNISSYRRWYQSFLLVTCPLTDSELQAYPYYLYQDDQVIIDQQEIYLKNVSNAGLEIYPHSLREGGYRNEAGNSENGNSESPLRITSGLLYHGETNHD